MPRMSRVGKHATAIIQRQEDNQVIYHGTPVVTWNEHQIVLRSGGWETVTTKTRMNQASYEYRLGYHVFQKDHQWYVTFKGEDHEFYDGMILER